MVQRDIKCASVCDGVWEVRDLKWGMVGMEDFPLPAVFKRRV